MQNVIGWLLLLSAAVVLVWLSASARRIANRWLKWSAIVAASALAAVVWGFLVLAIAGTVKQHARSAAIPEIRVAGTPDQVLRGQAIVDSFCAACHSKYGPLTGGMDVGKHLAVPVGSFVSSNLTPAGALAHWTDGEIFRAIRNGVDAQGNWLTIMTYTNVNHLSDADIEALIAYLRSRPAIGAPTPNPPDHFNLLGLMMLGAGMLPSGSPVVAGTVKAPSKGPTVEYGQYILSYQDCRACHGASLTGGVPGQIAPVGPSLQLVKSWKVEQFIATFRTGKDPTGRQLSEVMPWRTIGQMDDDELTAIYEYLTHSFN